LSPRRSQCASPWRYAFSQFSTLYSVSNGPMRRARYRAKSSYFGWQWHVLRKCPLSASHSLCDHLAKAACTLPKRLIRAITITLPLPLRMASPPASQPHKLPLIRKWDRPRRAAPQVHLTFAQKDFIRGNGTNELIRFTGPPVLRRYQGCVVNVLRSTSKITAVDHPNNNTPFIAVIGPSSRQRSTGSTSP
jgi:hypothetical protein